MSQEPVARNETCGQGWVINGEKHLLTSTASQVLCWADLMGSSVAERHYYALVLVFLFCWQLQRRWQWQGEKKGSVRRETCYHFALYKFQADFCGIECEPSLWEADDINDAVSTTGCCGYEPHCAYRSFVNIHDICVCVCMYVRIHVYMWYRILHILSFALYIPNRCHCWSVSNLLFPGFVAYEILKVSCSVLYSVHAACFVRMRKFETEIRIRS
jgi:hypothetical protein